jgi:hypothetical protein
LSILELSVILVILLSLVSILFIGTAAWKRGSDRAACVMTLRNMQIAARSYQNMYGYDYGDSPAETDGTRDITEHLYAKGYIEAKLYAQSRGESPCAAGGSYRCAVPDVFPACGRLFMNCSLVAAEGHAPLVHADW